MESIAAVPAPKYYRLLPYWAVLQTDLRQTLRSWAYRLWLTVSLVMAIGYLLYRFGLHHEAGLMQSASIHTSDVLRGLVLGSMALIVVLTVSSISSERGTLADSVLSRGISRYQYYMAKWHARTVAILATFLILSGTILIGSHVMLSEDVTFTGGLVAVAMVGLLLVPVVAWGVAISAMTNSTALGVTILWVVLYSIGFVMPLIPNSYPSPEHIFERLPHVLRGYYDLAALGDLALICGGLAGLAAIVGLVGFVRKDV